MKTNWNKRNVPNDWRAGHGISLVRLWLGVFIYEDKFGIQILLLSLLAKNHYDSNFCYDQACMNFNIPWMGKLLLELKTFHPNRALRFLFTTLLF